ncbi:hypothetical protein AYI87_00020 [Shewanella sp. KCT]|nr:hypothetical protein AYI87_00020 [Shewanella sp. KCT]
MGLTTKEKIQDLLLLSTSQRVITIYLEFFLLFILLPMRSFANIFTKTGKILSIFLLILLVELDLNSMK